jgi:hypothetical protein
MDRFVKKDIMNFASDEIDVTGDDGELLAIIFCLRCGAMNHAAAASCSRCGDLLAEQGPDLRSRLARIRRYAGGERIAYAPGFPLNQRSVSRKSTAPIGAGGVDHQLLLQRISSYAHRPSSEPPSSNSAVEMVMVSVFYASVFPLLQFLGRILRLNG